MRKDYDIVGSYNKQRYESIDAEDTVNLFEYVDPSSKKPKTLIPTSGIVDTNIIFNVPISGARAQFVFNGAMYMVVGNQFFRITVDSGGNLINSNIASLNTTVGYVGIDANQTQVILVDGINGYIYDTVGNGFGVILDPAFPSKPKDVCFLDGFFIVINDQTQDFYLSDLNNGLSWSSQTANFTVTGAPTSTIVLSSALNYATGTPVTLSVSGGGVLPVASPLLDSTTTYYVIRIDQSTIKLARSLQNAYQGIAIELTTNSTPTCTIDNNGQLQLGEISSHPGTVVACRTLHRRLFLFSQNFVEVWENAGIGSNLPFRRQNGLLMEVGTPATGSVSVGFDMLFFLSQDKDGLGSVMKVEGTQASAVGTRAIDYDFAQLAQQYDISDAKGILIKENGLIFYRINFTAADKTYVYNETMSDQQTKRWHREETLLGNRHPAQTHAYFNGYNYYGDYKDDILYYVDSTVSTNNGEAIRRMRIGRPIVDPSYNRIRIDRFHLDLVQGEPDYTSEVDWLLTESGKDLLTENESLILTENSYVLTAEQPVVFLSYSKDGGRSYNNIIPSPMGKIGERSFRTVWRKLGTIPRGQAFVPKIEFFNEVPFIILGAAWDFEIMPE
jgi:hypothetical protein